MISIVLYGRNDSHGYNLHKRAAISLNCIAEVLSDPDDEILFVDWNTPNDLPTFIEAIYDTLTDAVKARLRVYRVRPEQHARLVGRTHLFALEPHSRNIAIRRSNPRNRWILSTNTDMIFLARGGATDLTDAVRDIPDGQYIVPRYELPEPLWESFPRADPKAIMTACEDLGRKLHLEEIALRFPYMRFDSPGDFQLAPREALFDIQGFDERMIDGWHADSNMCKRLYIYYGERTENLGHRIKGYHCDHTRVATLAHRLDIKLENNLHEFVFGVKEAGVPDQAETWGAPNEVIEEIDFRDGAAARFVSAVSRAVGAPQETEYHTDANELRNFVSYPIEHTLSYVAGNLTVYPRTARFAYVGSNPRMLGLITKCVEEMGFVEPVRHSGAELLDHDLIIFDFGLDPAGLNLGIVRRVTDWPRDLRYRLGAVARCLRDSAEKCDELFRRTRRMPDFLVINANHYVFAHLVGQYLLATDTPYPTHVRKGRARIGEERLYRSSIWKYSEDLLRAWFAYDVEDYSVPTIGPGDTIDMTYATPTAAYKDGHWGAMDSTGCWIDGTRAAILFAPPASFTSDMVAYVRINEAFLPLDGGPMRLQVFFEGELLARWTVYMKLEMTVCKAVLPGRLLTGKSECRLELVVENPQSAEEVARATGQDLIGEDPRELGVRIQEIKFTGADRLTFKFGDTLDFTEKEQGPFYTNECWTPPDGLGMWTLGPSAGLVMLLDQPVASPVLATFSITDVAIGGDHPNLEVTVSFNGRVVAEWMLGPLRIADDRHILLLDGFPTRDPIHVSFAIKEPQSPMQLGWSGHDTRPLGFRLTRFRMGSARSVTYEPGDLIDFTEGGNSGIFVGKFLGTQWGVPDRYGSWTVGTEATMKVPFDKPPQSALPAVFVISDCMVSRKAPKLAVRVKANGRQITEWDLGPDREVRKIPVMLPAEVTTGAKEIVFTFEIPDARSPESLGWTSDARPLGIRLARAVIGSSEIEMPTFARKFTGMRGKVARLRRLPAFSVHLAKLALRRLRQ